MSLCLDDGFVDVGPEGVEGRGLGVCEGVGLLRGTAFLGWSESWLVISCSHRYRKVVNEKKNERVGSGERVGSVGRESEERKKERKRRGKE